MMKRLSSTAPSDHAGVAAAVIFLWFGLCQSGDGQGTISGIVRSESGPVEGAVVRIQTTPVFTTCDRFGRFTLTGIAPKQKVALTTYKPGYYIAGPMLASTETPDVSLALIRHVMNDNPKYQWVSAFREAGQTGNCGNCHSDLRDPHSLLPFDEWRRDVHGTSATNARFLSMYNGTDLSGTHHSPLTHYTENRDYGRFPRPPDPDEPYFGPGYLLDSLGGPGNCAACHVPAAAVNAPYGTDPNGKSPAHRESVACDLCHKLWAVKLDPASGLPRPNTPGVLSMEFRRPPEGHQLFLGPFDDVAPGEDTYSPLQRQSQICAPCHSGDFWGVQVYNSFGEWLASPYADPEKGQTCQDCHMPRRGARHIALPEKGGLQRDVKTVFSHLMPGAADEALLKDTAKIEMDARLREDRILVDVRVTNEKAGHHIPTDHPARNILLVLSATDGRGSELEDMGTQRIPDWGGKGKSADDYADRPGKGYAKILEELWTEVSPTAAYWRQTRLKADTRIPAKGVDITHYEFRAPREGGPVAIKARLLFRRAFKKLADQKSWNVPDILMNETSLTVRLAPNER
jgi:mono/diheme cytochrome c family protein